MRPDRVELSLQTRPLGAVTDRDTELARRVTHDLGKLGVRPTGAVSAESPRPVQMLEMAIDAMDIPAIRPFWKAALAYTDEPGHDGQEDAIVDPAPPYVPDVRPHTAPPPGTAVAVEYGLTAGPDWVGAGARSLG